MNELEMARKLAPACGLTHYIKQDRTYTKNGGVHHADDMYQFFMIKNGKSFIPVVGLLRTNEVHWIQVILTDTVLSALKELGCYDEI